MNKRLIKKSISVLLVIVMVLGMTVIVADANSSSYTVNFDGNGATGGETESLSVDKNASNFVLPECGFTKQGYHFAGWKPDFNPLNQTVQPGDVIDKANFYILFGSSDTTTFHAYWEEGEAPSYTFNFDGNDATSGTTESITGISKTSKVTMPECGYSKEGYQFSEWNSKKDGTGLAVDPGRVVTGSEIQTFVPNPSEITWYAIWRKNGEALTYTFNFDGNGATFGSTQSITGIKKNSNVTMPNCGFNRDDYTFKCWNSRSDGTGISLNAGTVISGYQIASYVPNPSEITWYAIWSAPDIVIHDGNVFVKSVDGSVRCYDTNGNPVINQFKCDGVYTYYFQLDGTAMQDRLTYHPDGQHVIYFDENGHEVFSNFAHVRKSIANNPVDDYCFFDVYGYQYVDVLTYDQTGQKILYANAYGVIQEGWFQYFPYVKWADGTPANGHKGQYGFTQWDKSLLINTWTIDWMGRWCYMHGNGVALY